MVKKDVFKLLEVTYALRLENFKSLLGVVHQDSEEDFTFDHVSVAMQHCHVLKSCQMLMGSMTTWNFLRYHKEENMSILTKLLGLARARSLIDLQFVIVFRQG